MRIILTKISDLRHALEIVREDYTRERVELASREFLFHDLLHYAMESSIGTQEGFWGALAAGKTMADLNDRTGRQYFPGGSMEDYVGVMGDVEQAVGALTGAIKGGATPGTIIEAVRNAREASGQTMPEWFTERMIADVRERMRRLQGHWKATPYRKSMELEWSAPPSGARGARPGPTR